MNPYEVAEARAARREACTLNGEIELLEAVVAFEKQPEQVALRLAQENKQAERQAWIESLPEKLNDFLSIRDGEVVDHIGNYICQLPATGSSIEEIILAADTAESEE